MLPISMHTPSCITMHDDQEGEEKEVKKEEEQNQDFHVRFLDLVKNYSCAVS